MSKKGNVKEKLDRKFDKYITKAPADFGILILTLILIVFGVVMVFSASFYWSMDRFGSTYGYLIKGGVYAFVGIIVMMAVSRIDYKILRKYYVYIYAFSIVLLLLIFTPLGKNTNGATRWLDFGITIMPGEVAKIAMIIFIAGLLSSRKKDMNSAKQSTIPALFFMAIVVVLIMMQPNMSTAVTIAAIVIAMMFVAGINLKHFWPIAALGIATLFVMVFAGDDNYRVARVMSFRHPFEDIAGDGYQVVQSLLALGTGGLCGKGLGDSTQKTLYLPEPQNDFILAIIGEELGFIGVLAMIIVFALLIWRGIKVAINAPDKFGFLLCSGVMMLIGIQLVLNVAIVTSTIPPTGVALPFVSYGGNATILYCAAVGMVLNVSRQINQNKRNEMINKRNEEKVIFNRGAK